jgi:hypothetical protein
MTRIYKRIQAMLATLLLTLVSQSADAQECQSCCEPCGKFYLSADLLYWTAHQSGINECFTLKDSDHIDSRHVISRFKGKVEEPSRNWDLGYRLGLGYEFGCDWNAAVYWTHFDSNSGKNHGHHHCFNWKIDFDVVDVLLAKKIDAGSCVTLKPFLGLRGAYIDQRVKTTFIGTHEDHSYSDCAESSYSYGCVNNLAKTDNKSKFSGIGPLIGVEADWNLGCGVSVYANAAVGGLYGRFHLHLKQSDEFLGGADCCDVTQHSHSCHGVFDAGLGVRWATCLCNDMELLVQLGLEHHTYFNQNQFGNYGDLCLGGLTLGAGLSF